MSFNSDQRSLRDGFGFLFLGVVLSITSGWVVNMVDRYYVHFGIWYDITVIVLFIFIIYICNKNFNLLLKEREKSQMTTKTRFKLIASVYLFFIRDGKILLLRRANTGYEDGNYSLVAGHADGEERLTEAAVREGREESGVEIDPKDLELRHVMHRRQDDERVDFFFEVKKWKGEPKNMEPGKCDDLSWFPLNALPHNTIPYIRQAIEGYARKNYYSEYWKPEN